MEPRTLEDLVHKFCSDPDIPSNRKSMTRTACMHATKALDYASIDDVPVHRVFAAQQALSTYLATTQLSVRSCVNYKSFLTRFIVWCQDKHLLPRNLEKKLTTEWFDLTYPLKDVESGRKGHRDGLRKLAQWCTGFAIQPAALTQDDLKAYAEYLEHESGLNVWRPIFNRAQAEWIHHVQEDSAPHLDWPPLPSATRSTYALKLEHWPPQMQVEYKKYRKWCTDEFRLDRPLRYKQRSSSANQNLSTMQRILGYAHHFNGLPIEDFNMDLFFNQSLINGYFQWLVTERSNGKKSVILETIVAQLLGMANGYFKQPDASSWLLPLKQQVSGAEVRDKKQMAFTIQELNDVADGIRDKRIVQKQRAKAKKQEPSKKQQSRLVMFELIMRLFIQRLLRRKNVCEIRIGTNLIQTDDHTYILKYKPDEMKSRSGLTFSFPGTLVPLLEEYIEHYRPILCDGYDSDYLFPSRAEKHISGDSVLNFIRRHSIRVVGKPLFPHLIRHSIAIEFLKEHPEDYLTLSKMLHHSSVETTIEEYGHFDNNDAAEAFDKMMKKKGVGSDHSNE